MFLPNWRYDGKDPGLRLFTLANAKLPTLERGRVFEIGSHDTDFLERASVSHPNISAFGVDWRPDPRPNVEQGDILTYDIPVFEAAISISAIEHVGLGRYDGDPRDHYGDIKAVQRIRDWLGPHTFFYFDVPYTPEGYGLLDVNKCRCYDDEALLDRFGPHEVLGYADSTCERWIDKPTQNNPGPRPYWYVALLIRKEHG